MRTADTSRGAVGITTATYHTFGGSFGDSGVFEDSGVGFIVPEPAGATVRRSTPAGAAAAATSCLYDFADCEGNGSEVVGFPTAADPRVIASGTNPWNAGDWFEGVRMTMVPSIGQVDVHLELVDNSLTACGFQEAEVSINGVALGTFTVAQNDTVIDQSFPVVPAIAGLAYIIRYEATTSGGGGILAECWRGVGGLGLVVAVAGRWH